MLTFSGPSFWLFLLYFCVSIFIAFYIPGSLLLKSFQLSRYQKVILSLVVGMVLWGFQGFIFGFLNLRWLSYVYLALCLILWCWYVFKIKEKITFAFKLQRIDILLIILIVLGTFTQVIHLFFTGVEYPGGIFFCCGNIPDNIYHIALTDSIIKTFPPYEPGMQGVIVHNYHYWGNLVMGELIRVFKLPLIWTQFQYGSILISLLLGLTSIVFTQLIKIDKKFTAWLLFFLYFGGDLGYLVMFFLGKGINFDMQALENGAIFLLNPPRAFSIIVFLSGMSLFLLWIKKRDIRIGLVMAVVFASLVGFKVYTGIFALVGLVAVSVYFLFARQFFFVIPVIVTFLLTALVYLPVNSGAGGLYFTGLWRFENFIVNPYMGLERMALALKIYQDHNNYLRIIQYELIFFGLFCLNTFGTKLIGFIQTKKSLSLFPKELHIFFIPALVMSAFVGFFFQQSAGGANSFNFLASVFIIGSFYTALSCYYLTEKIKWPLNYIFLVLVIVITLPRTVYLTLDTVHQIKERYFFFLTNEEIEGYKFLQANNNGEIIGIDPRALSAADSLYVSFMANHSVYLSGNGILESHGISVKEREKVVLNIVTTEDELVVAKNLLNTRINYLLLKPQEDLAALRSAYFLETVFKNDVIKILKFSPEKAKEYVQRSKINLKRVEI